MINSIKETDKKIIFELLAIIILCIISYIISMKYDLLEKFTEYSNQHENYELDEILIVTFFSFIFISIFSIRRWMDSKKAKLEISNKNEILEKVLSEIKELKGIIPICSSCKKIRDDEGFWHQVEVYVKKHSNADFTHGICPDCVKELYPEFAKRIDNT